MTARPHRPGQRPAPTPRPAERVVLLDVEIARQLSLSLADTRALLRVGSIPARRVGGVWTTTQARLSAWVDALPSADPADPAGLDDADDGGQDA
ncbi:hypothetical protein [Candidatus Frankia alpina]|uniref:hypothetical protein n=1 Tax=Candidatus Frankia alpina TaxID=2699483 RepID=UPI001A981339|nr:hypothetical protein [Candidatus Frankia alpina]